jgi:hypothetical protein
MRLRFTLPRHGFHAATSCLTALQDSKVENIQEDSLDLIPSPSPSVKVQAIVGKKYLSLCFAFEFSVKVKVMGSNPDYLLNFFLLYQQYTGLT